MCNPTWHQFGVGFVCFGGASLLYNPGWPRTYYIYTKLAPNLWQLSWFVLPGTQIAGVYHHGAFSVLIQLLFKVKVGFVKQSDLVRYWQILNT